MRIYSAQEKTFIEAELFASSEFRPQDGRTALNYYIDSKNLIHSQSLNYSLLYSRPLSIEQFNKVVDNSSDYYRITVH